jgi:hypothetical protein
VKPFPKQPAAARGRGEEGEGETKPKSKSDPWLTGCLGLVIIAIILLGAYFIYDNFIKEKPAPTLPESGIENGSRPAIFTQLGLQYEIDSAANA